MKHLDRPISAPRQRGFTLVEIMIALGVMVVVIVGLLSAILYASRQNAINRENLLAMRGAEQMLEQVRARNFPDIFDIYDDEDDARIVNVQGWPPGPVMAGVWAPANETYPDPLHPEPGPWFNVPGLTPPAGRPAVGRIMFPGCLPTTMPPPGGPAPVLAEGLTGDADFDRFLKVDAASPANPLNHDLDLDTTPDEPDVSTTYQMLPIAIEIQWAGIIGTRTVRYYHLLRQR